MLENGVPPGPEGSPLLEKKLVSWKEIAAHLGREVRTVQRWEKTEGLPVKRHEHLKKSTVYAYPSELDDWVRKRQPVDDPEADDAFAREQELSGTDSPIDSVDPPDVLPAPVDSIRIDPSPDPVKPPPPPIWRRGVIAVSSLAIFSAASFAIYHWTQPNNSADEKIRLVVLPFANLSGDPKQDYISMGITEDINTQLGRLDPPHLAVIAPTSAAVVSRKGVSEIRRELGVKYILEGSVQSSSGQVRIEVRLIDTSDATFAWTQTFTRELSDLLRVESEVSEAVARQMVKSLPEGPPPPLASTAASPATASNITKSRDAYLQGKYAWGSRRDPQSGINFFQRAIDLDPSYAQAYAGLASAITVFGQVPNDGMLPVEAKPKAREAAKHALELDPRLAEAHAVLGNVAFSFDWDLPSAEKELKTAIALNPNQPTTHQWYAYVLMLEGRFDEALAESRYGLELEPATPLFHAVRTEVLCYARKYDEAIEEALSSIKVGPDFPLSYYWLGYAYREKKMYAEAIAAFSTARQIAGDKPFLVMAYGHAQALAGNTKEARESLKLLESVRHTRFVPDIYQAAIHVGLGEKDEAFRLLNNAYLQRIDRLVYLKIEPLADPLRSDTRFQELLDKIGLR